MVLVLYLVLLELRSSGNQFGVVAVSFAPNLCEVGSVFAKDCKCGGELRFQISNLFVREVDVSLVCLAF